MAAVRRTGGMPALHAMYHYLSYMEMLLPTSNYWAVVHGRNPGEVLLDEEGMQTVCLLAENMAWILSLRIRRGPASAGSGGKASDQFYKSRP